MRTGTAHSSPVYGAERIAERYPASMMWSLGVAVGILLLTVAYPYVREKLRRPSDEKIPVAATRVINYSELQAPPPIDLERRIPEPLEAQPKAKTVRYLPPVVKKDEEVPDDQLLPTRDEMSDALIGTQNVEGVDSVYFEPAETKVVSEHPEPPKSEEVFNFVETMPEFPGGQEAFMEWMASQMRYPAMAREAEIQGTVFISFVIESDGSITNTEVVRSVHPLLDEEAMRVISSMPPWSPGVQNNYPVRVRYTLPVAFRLRY